MASQFTWTTLVSLLLFGQGGPGEGVQPTVSPQEIERAVKQLGDDSFAVRERASEFLWKAGPAARTALERAAHSNDREVAWRANTILERFRFGIYPGTPPEVIELVDQYRRGDLSVKQNVLNQLHSKKQLQTMLALLKTETDPQVQQQLAANYLRETGNLVPQFLVDGDFSRAEELLEWGAMFDARGDCARDYSAYLLLRGKLDAEIAQQQDAGETRFLAYLHRAAGNIPEARRQAEKTDDKYLLADLLYRQEDWPALLEKELTPGDAGIEKLGFTAAFSRLAGNADGFEKAISDIRQLAADKPDRAWMCGEALMINDRWQEAIDLFSNRVPDRAVRLLCQQYRFVEAFKLAGIPDARTGSARWFADRCRPMEIESKELSAHFQMGLTVARELYRLGEAEESERLFAELTKVAIDEKQHRLLSLFATEWKLGLEGPAMAHAAQALAHEASIYSVCRTLFGDRGSTAASWWHLLRAQSPEEDRDVTLRRLRDLFRTEGERNETRVKISELARQAEQVTTTIDEKKRPARVRAIAELCVLHGEHEMGRAYLEKQAAVLRSYPAMLRIGDSFAEERKWQDAADSYGRAWHADNQNPLALYLQGHALHSAGRENEGRRLMDLALLLPLADSEKRQAFATGLQQRGLQKTALEQWELILRLGPFQSWEGSQAWAVGAAGKSIADGISRSDPLRAAALWERYLFYLLKTNASLTEVEMYPRFIHLIHKARALGLLRAGQVDEAIREAVRANDALPAAADSVIQLVEAFEVADRRDVADKMFEKAVETHEKVCREFPNSSRDHNNFAWLAARCRRRVDLALTHARRAVDLSPDKAAYIDTLAEACFANGRRDEAIKHAERCVGLEPQKEHFRKQLDRFRSGDSR